MRLIARSNAAPESSDPFLNLVVVDHRDFPPSRRTLRPRSLSPCVPLGGAMHVRPQGIVDNNCFTSGERLHRVARVRRHERNGPRAGYLGFISDSHVQLSFDDVPDFLIRMRMRKSGTSSKVAWK